MDGSYAMDDICGLDKMFVFSLGGILGSKLELQTQNIQHLRDTGIGNTDAKFLTFCEKMLMVYIYEQ